MARAVVFHHLQDQHRLAPLNQQVVAVEVPVALPLHQPQVDLVVELHTHQMEPALRGTHRQHPHHKVTQGVTEELGPDQVMDITPVVEVGREHQGATEPEHQTLAALVAVVLHQVFQAPLLLTLEEVVVLVMRVEVPQTPLEVLAAAVMPEIPDRLALQTEVVVVVGLTTARVQEMVGQVALASSSSRSINKRSHER